MLDTVVIWFVIVSLIPIKLLLILFRFSQLWRAEKNKVLTSIFLPIMLVLACLFDMQAVPYLWMYRLGTETKGTVIEFFKTSKSHFVLYEYSVDNVVFQNQQHTSIPYYETITTGKAVTVKYDPANPGTSYLIDVEELKSQTWFTLFVGLGVILALFGVEMREKIYSILNNDLQANKPA